ncbi:hypothetical protein COU75_02185 [Candidatus Peregrinibacteria bacterium CG10_big_fil_rev_8_21_14_0_10_42_8]|nr:MAG: hypothetical protein COU75_02185 [Candidatus Peregrinibacteria bacterium CG10_big_fil_rev_8_21_14_0_10_42_8]
MDHNSFFSGLNKDLTPEEKIKVRIGNRIQSRISSTENVFIQLRKDVQPQAHVKNIIWSRILPIIESPVVETLENMKDSLTPSENFRQSLRSKILRSFQSLEPTQAEAVGPVALKWVASFALFALCVQMSPMLFIASSTVAKTEVVLLPTRGEVSVSIGGMWQTVDRELVLEPGMLLRTHDGEASILLHDDGVIRLAEKTTVQIDDLSDRLDAVSSVEPVITLFTGKIWVQGLVPPQLPGITIANSFGSVTVNKGSVSIAEDDHVDVEVYDRSASVTRNGEAVYLASGERTQLFEDNPVLLVKKIPNKWYQYVWADQNLQRDAVHRHGIAQQQHERRIAQAGILPTSRLYPVKRFAELMDVMMTFDTEVRVQKRLQLAETRLNEAAALIYEGEEADVALNDYKETLQLLAANDYKNGSLTEHLIQQAIAESASQYSAVQPGDESYVITKTVLEASAGLPTQVGAEEHAQGTLLLDGLAVLVRAVEEGNSDIVRTVWSDLQPYLKVFEDENLVMNPLMYKEAKTLLAFLATSLHEANGRGVDIDPVLLSDIASYLPAPADTSVVTLSEDEIMEIVMGIKEKIFVYDMTKPRINQFVAEMKALEGHPDQGRILRRLAITLPDGPESFPDKVYKEIVKLRWENVGATI